MLKQSLEEPVHTDHTCQNPTDPKVLTSHIEEVRIQIFYLKHSVNLIKSDLNDILIGQFLLNIEEVMHELADVPHCIGQCRHPFFDFNVIRGLDYRSVDVVLGCLEDVFLVFGFVDYAEGFVVELDVPVTLAHF